MEENTQITKETKMLVDIKECPYIYWSPSRGRRLKSLLGNATDQEVSDRVKAKGTDCSRPLVNKMVNGTALSVNPQVLIDICESFSISLSDIIPVRVENESKEFPNFP